VDGSLQAEISYSAAPVETWVHLHLETAALSSEIRLMARIDGLSGEWGRGQATHELGWWQRALSE
jgi:hypothetical protein